MGRNYLVANLVFDRSVVPGADEYAVGGLIETLARTAPSWAGQGTTWSADPLARRPVDIGDPDAVGRAVAAATRLAADDRNSGSVELRGVTDEIAVIVSVHDRPLWRVGGRLLLGNSIRVELRRKSVDGRPAAEWLADALPQLCESTMPVWGAGHVEDEYWAKVMTETPSIRAVGRDFARFLPGLFPMNYFGRRYVELIGADRFANVASVVHVERIGPGFLVRPTAGLTTRSRPPQLTSRFSR